MLYPFKLKPIYKEILWGGRKIGSYFNRKIPEGNIAESWELCCREDGMNIIKNGQLEGNSLLDLISEYKEKVLGIKVYEKYGVYFPLLIKFIDANDKLSVQVHPDDDYAKLIGEKNGKNEVWYIIDAKKDAKLIYGLKENVSREDFISAIKSNKICETLNEVYVKPGDCIYIPSGTVHAIMDGILLAEIQQNSNTTFRIYDWDRYDSHGNKRELNIDKALDVINFNNKALLKKDYEKVFSKNYTITKLLRSEYFNVDELLINDIYKSNTAKDSFMVLLNINGSGKILWDCKDESINPGDTLLLPAFLGDFEIKGNMKMLMAYII